MGPMKRLLQRCCCCCRRRHSSNPVTDTPVASLLANQAPGQGPESISLENIESGDPTPAAENRAGLARPPSAPGRLSPPGPGGGGPRSVSAISAAYHSATSLSDEEDDGMRSPDVEDDGMRSPMSPTDFHTAPSVGVEEKLGARAAAGIRERLILALADEEGWVSMQNKPNLKVSRKMAPGGAPGRERDLAMWKVRTTLEASPRAVLNKLLDATAQPKWNPVVSSVEDLGADHGATMLRTCFKGMFGVAAREGIEFRETFEEEEALFVGYTSHGTESLDMEPRAGAQRCYCTLSGYRLAPGQGEGTCEFTFLSLADPGGQIPDWLMNKVGSKGAIDFCAALQSGLKRDGA
mmetsp:Transcript_65992/g.151148  ORF Transcript_65992/g.151148 Transcript_65992/m.151148 type:complete len:350 (-) Transcript_65992:247-1296(-)